MKTSVLLAVFSFGIARLAFATDAPPAEVVLFDHAKVDAAFAKGLPLMANASYKISAGRRVTGGTAELHEHDTDLFYVIEGSATFVTGGTLVEPKESSPGEVRAKSITGGVERHLTKGDIIVIPKGVPHQFKAVEGTFLYHVVKVTQ
jgi:quercetin dioxygenase-like cupin family protein